MSRGALGVLLAAIGAVLFGAAGPLAGLLVETLEPIQISGVRLAIAAVALAPLTVRRWRTIRPVLLGVIGLGVFQLTMSTTYYFSLARIGVGPAIGIEFLAPMVVVVWDRVSGAARPRRTTWVAVVLAVIGVGLVVEAGSPADLDLIGVAWGLGATAALTGYLKLAEWLGRRIDGISMSAGSITFGGLIGLAVGQPWQLIGEPAIGGDTVALLVVLGVVGMAIPFTLETSALTFAPARIIGVVITIEPVSAALTAWLFLDQALTASQSVGLVLIVGAVAAVAMVAGEASDDPVPVAVGGTV